MRRAAYRITGTSASPLFLFRASAPANALFAPFVRSYCTTEAPPRSEPPAPRPREEDADGEKKIKSNDFYVGGGSSVNKVAGACCYALRDFESAGMRAIGARAVNQGIKAAAVARNFLAREEKGVIGRIENARVVSYERTTQTMPKLGAHILLYNNKEVIEVQEREDERILTVAARTLPRNLAAAIK
eukprot:gene22712-34783_t